MTGSPTNDPCSRLSFFVFSLQKWSKGKTRDKLNNMVLMDKATEDKLRKEVVNYKLITPAILSERLKIRGSLARAVILLLQREGETFLSRLVGRCNSWLNCSIFACRSMEFVFFRTNFSVSLIIMVVLVCYNSLIANIFVLRAILIFHRARKSRLELFHHYFKSGRLIDWLTLFLHFLLIHFLQAKSDRSSVTGPSLFTREQAKDRKRMSRRRKSSPTPSPKRERRRRVPPKEQQQQQRLSRHEMESCSFSAAPVCFGIHPCSFFSLYFPCAVSWWFVTTNGEDSAENEFRSVIFRASYISLDTAKLIFRGTHLWFNGENS